MISAGSAALQARLFAAAVACLEEGSPDARACGRQMLLALHDHIISAGAFQDLTDKLSKKGQRLKVQQVTSFLS